MFKMRCEIFGYPSLFSRWNKGGFETLILDETDIHYITLILSGHLSSYAIWKATKNTQYGMAYNNTYKRIRKMEEAGIISTGKPQSYSQHGAVTIHFDKKKTIELLREKSDQYKQLISKIEKATRGMSL